MLIILNKIRFIRIIRLFVVKIQKMFKDVLRKVPLGSNLLCKVFDEQNTVADEKSLGNST